MPREGGGRTQEKEAMTQFLYLLETVRGLYATHIPVDALSEGPIQLAFKKYINAAYLIWENH